MLLDVFLVLGFGVFDFGHVIYFIVVFVNTMVRSMEPIINTFYR